MGNNSIPLVVLFQDSQFALVFEFFSVFFVYELVVFW